MRLFERSSRITRFRGSSRFGSQAVLGSLLACALSACAPSMPTSAANSNSPDLSSSAELSETFLDSGSIILSHQVPAQLPQAALDAQQAFNQLGETSPQVMAPLMGYFPPASAYVAADNEVWMEIGSTSHKISLFRGKTLLKEIQGEGEVALSVGEYYLQHKQKNPVWYAPDSYFSKRQLNVPSPGDRLRYRRGALGEFALYPTTSFPIHCAALWTDEVGGLRVSPDELGSLFLELPVGAPIVVR